MSKRTRQRQGASRHTFGLYKIDNIDQCISELLSRGYWELELLPQYKQYKLYVHDAPTTKPPKWKAVLSEIVTEAQEIKKLTNKTASFALFIDTGSNQYATTGGLAGYVIQRHCDPEFGISIAVRILPTNRIRSIRSKMFTGRVLQDDVVYRTYYDISLDPAYLGRLARDIVGELDKEDVLSQLGVEFEDRRPIKLKATATAFTMQRSLTADELFTLSSAFDKVLDRELPEEFALFRGYSEVRSGELIPKLRKLLEEALASQYSEFLTDPDDFYETNLGLSYDDPKQLLLCDHFIVRLGNYEEEIEHLDLWHMFDALKRMNRNEIKTGYLSALHISGYDSDGKPQVNDGTLYAYLYAEIQTNNPGHVYTLSDSKWYQTTDAFLDSINERLKMIIEKSGKLLRGFSTPGWQIVNSKTIKEDDYIDTVCSNTNLWKLHKTHIIIKGSDKSEACDILDSRKKPEKLIFIKKGFGSFLREVLGQARTSCELLVREPSFKKKANDIISKITSQKISEIEFQDCLVVVLTTDHSTKRPNQNLVDKLTTVAKLDIIETERFINSDLRFEGFCLHEVKHTIST